MPLGGQQNGRKMQPEARPLGDRAKFGGLSEGRETGSQEIALHTRMVTTNLRSDLLRQYPVAKCKARLQNARGLLGQKSPPRPKPPKSDATPDFGDAKAAAHRLLRSRQS